MTPLIGIIELKPKLFPLSNPFPHLVQPLSADVPDADSSGQCLLPLGVPPHYHLSVLSQQDLQLGVNSILKENNKGTKEEDEGVKMSHGFRCKLALS